jgi:excisionase family DNA binding protein
MITATPRAYTVAQVAELWGVSDTFVYDLCHAGQLDGAFKLGKKLWRIPPDALGEYEARALAITNDSGEEPDPAPPPSA